MIIDSKQYNGLCSCGKSHQMETEFCLVESGCLRQAEEYLEKYGLRGYTVAVYDENTYAATADYLKTILREGDHVLFKASRSMKLETMAEAVTGN